jgi:putative colanic acid biosynthesis glycosyltransferase
MVNSMTITVITVVRDDLNGLIKTGESLRPAIGRDVDWVIIDSSQESVEKELSNHNFIYTLSYMPPRGIYAAMNAGISRSKGKWLWFLNAGDEMNCNLSELRSVLENFPNASGIAFSVNALSRRGTFLRLLPPYTKINEVTKKIELHTNHQGFIFQRSTLDTNAYNTEFRYAADTLLIDNLANTGEVVINEMAIANFYINGRSAQNYKKVVAELDEIRPQDLNLKKSIKREWLFLKTLLRRLIY